MRRVGVADVRTVFMTALLCLGPTLVACSDSAEVDVRVTGELPAHGDLLFVVRGGVTVDGRTLEVEADTVEWFTDRPERQAGIAPVDDLADKWDAFGFGDDPPNAAFVGTDVDAVVELAHPEVVPNGIEFEFRPIRGELRAGDMTVFIDPVSDPTQTGG